MGWPGRTTTGPTSDRNQNMRLRLIQVFDIATNSDFTNFANFALRIIVKLILSETIRLIPNVFLLLKKRGYLVEKKSPFDLALLHPCCNLTMPLLSSAFNNNAEEDLNEIPVYA